MLDHHEGIVRQVHHSCDILRCHFEWFGAKYHRALPKLLEADSIMQTARGATASITQSGDQEVNLISWVSLCFIWGGGAGVFLGVERRYRTAVPCLE